MTTARRSIDECPWRQPLSAQVGNDQFCCQLLARVTGITDRELLVVDRAACEACCETFASTERDLNPVVASLLFQLTDSIVEGRVSAETCSVEQAGKLRSRALANIPTLHPHDHEFHVAAVRPLDAFDWLTPTHLSELVPPPVTRCDPVSEWAVGVTTAPRRQPTLPQCLERLTAAGWDDPVVFVDGPAEVPEAGAALPFTRRDRSTGAWPNSYLALLELYLRKPTAGAYLLLQDDVILPGSAAVRAYLETVFWPGDKPGIVSLFCSAQYTREQPGWHAIDEAWVWGAQALAFHPEVLARFLTDPIVYQHRRRTDGERMGLTHIDVMIGQWAYRHNVPVWYPTPSLVQHIGHVSSLWETSRALGLRRADHYVEDLLFSDTA